MTCHCGSDKVGTKRCLSLLISLNKKLAFINYQTPGGFDLDNELQNSCEQCLASMDNDLDGEVEAIRYQSDIKPIKYSDISKQLVILSEGNLEYQRVKKRFNQSLSNGIIRIEKNINPELLKQYELFKKTHQSNTGELLLFHGSNNGNYIKILSEGFDISLSKDGLQGHGAYFATDSRYSKGYTNVICLDDMESKLVANMLVCYVYPTSDTGCLDKNYCVRSNKQCYPAYVVYYDSS